MEKSNLEPTNDLGKITGLKVVLIIPIIFIFIAFLLNLFYSLPVKDTLIWYTGTFLCLFVPGNLLLRWLNFNKDDHHFNLFHSIALGTAFLPLLYMVTRIIEKPELIYLFVPFMFLLWLIYVIKDFNKLHEAYTSYRDILSILVLLVIIFLLLHLSYFKDIIFLGNELKMNVSHFTETEFHLNIVDMLKNKFPPLYPHASGFDFSYYHLFMHLEIELFNRFFSIDTVKLTYFYFPLLYCFLLVFLPYMLIMKHNGNRFIAVLAGLFMFGSDLSFIPGVLGIFQPGFQWNLLMNATVAPLLTLNSFLPALPIMFLCILYLKRFYENGRLLYLIAFAFLGFSAYGFKSPVGLHIMGTSFFVGILSTVFMNDGKGKLLCAVSAISIFVIALDVLFIRCGIGNNIIEIDQFNRFSSTFTSLGVSDMPWFLYPAGFILYFLLHLV